METYELIRSRRKTLALEITREGRVVVRAPQRLPRSTIDEFVDRHADWIARHLERQRRRLADAPPPPTPEEIEVLKAKARADLPVRQLQRKGQPVLLLLSDELPGGGHRPGGGP